MKLMPCFSIPDNRGNFVPIWNTYKDGDPLFYWYRTRPPKDIMGDDCGEHDFDVRHLPAHLIDGHNLEPQSSGFTDAAEWVLETRRVHRAVIANAIAEGHDFEAHEKARRQALFAHETQIASSPAPQP